MDKQPAKFTFAEKLFPASYRGVRFFVEDAEIGAGRRKQVNEYPQRDKPYIEDLGRATREYRVTGYIFGENLGTAKEQDYVACTNKMLAALEMPGAGMLMHPWHGNLDVEVKELGRIRYDRGLGRAIIEMVFTEAGDVQFPTVQTSTQSASAAAADDVGTAAAADFASKFSVNKVMDYVNAAAKGDIQRLFQMAGFSNIPGVSQLAMAQKALDATQSAIKLINDPAALGRNILGAFGAYSLLNSIQTIGAALGGSSSASVSASQATQVASLIRATLSASYAFSSYVSINSSGSISSAATPASRQQYANTAALADLARRSLLVQAVGLSAAMPAVVHDDAIGIRNLLADALDAEALTAPDGVYVALSAARVAVWNDLTDRAKNSARIVSITPPQSIPALALAYDYYGDTSRADEIIARNAIENPLFVPVQPIKVISA